MGYYDWTDLPYYYDLVFRLAHQRPFFLFDFHFDCSESHVHVCGDLVRSCVAGHSTARRLDAAHDFHFSRHGCIPWHMYYHDTNHIFLTGFSIYSSDDQKVSALGNSLDPLANWRSALQHESTLPPVIFIERGGTPGTGTDEHPGANIEVGAADTASIINALMQSPA